MRKSYLLVYSDSWSRESVKNCLSSIPEVINWRYDMPNCFYIISEDTATNIATSIRRKLGNKRFLITEISPNKQGWLPSDTWYLINNKEKRPK